MVVPLDFKLRIIITLILLLEYKYVNCQVYIVFFAFSPFSYTLLIHTFSLFFFLFLFNNGYKYLCNICVELSLLINLEKSIFKIVPNAEKYSLKIIIIWGEKKSKKLNSKGQYIYRPPFSQTHYGR